MKKLKWSVMTFFAIMGVSQAQVGIERTNVNTLISIAKPGDNNAVGLDVLKLTTTLGIRNSGFGFRALYSTTDGIENTAAGYRSLFYNKLGSYNTSFGSDSGQKTGFSGGASKFNSFFGYKAGFNIDTGSNNTIIGANVLGTAEMSNHVIIGDGVGRQRIFINQRGAVGIGNTNPQFGLHIGGNNVENSPTESLAAIGIGTNTVLGKLILAHAAFDYSYCNQAQKGDAVISGSTTGSLIIASEHAGGSTPGNAGQGIKFVTQDTEPRSQVRMTIDKAGKILVGTATAPTKVGTANVSTYKLFVKGGILTEEMRVRLATDWADYVFNKNYQLKSLKEVENFINTNGHLPNVPSAKEVKENGLELGTIATIQQEKIEELTLYAIQQQKEIEDLKVLVKTLVDKK